MSSNRLTYSPFRTVLLSFKREFAAAMVFSAVANILQLTPMLYMLLLFDRAMASGSEVSLMAVSVVALFFLIVSGLSEWLRARLLVRAGVAIDSELSSRVFLATFHAKLNKSRENPSKAFADLLTVRQFITGAGIFALLDAPWTIFYIAILFVIDFWVGMAAVAFVVLQVILGLASNRAQTPLMESSTKRQTEAYVYLNDKVRNLEVMETMGMTGKLYSSWLARYQKYLHAQHQLHEVNHRYVAIAKFLRYCQGSMGIGIGAIFVLAKGLTPWSLFAIFLPMGRALGGTDQLMSTWPQFATAKAAYRRLERLLDDSNPTALDPTAGVPLGELSVSALSAFTGADKQKAILDGVSAEFPAGSLTVVVGPSGSGKSTLARAVLGIWPFTQGTVLLDGKALSGWSRVELGPHVGYLPQDVELFDATIAENIARLRTLDSERIIAAAKLAGLHDMILRMPKGYDTPIGDGGNLLSGGQRQRIGLARAVYGWPQLIVLDEPNSNLDDAGEAALNETLRQLKEQKKTVILVTHRPAVIALADRLVVVENGRIPYQGPKDEVVAALQTRAAIASAAASTPVIAAPVAA